MFSMPLEWDSCFMSITQGAGLFRMYWNSWFYLLTNLSLSLFTCYSSSSFNLRYSVHSLCQAIYETFHRVFLFDYDFISSILEHFLSLCLNSSFIPIINNSFNQLFQQLLVYVFECIYNHYFEFYIWDFIAYSHLMAIVGGLVMCFGEVTLS